MKLGCGTKDSVIRFLYSIRYDKRKSSERTTSLSKSR